jgi:hypothetical protein
LPRSPSPPKPFTYNPSAASSGGGGGGGGGAAPKLSYSVRWQVLELLRLIFLGILSRVLIEGEGFLNWAGCSLILVRHVPNLIGGFLILGGT